MIKNLMYLYVLAPILLIAACSGQRSTQATADPEYFIFGSGGGFTGKYTEYKMHSDGTIEQLNFDNEDKFEPYAEVDRKEVQSFFTELDELQLQDLEYSHPGNMTWYIEVHDDSSSNRVKWGDYNTPVRPEIEAFFKKVNDFVLDLKP